MEKIDVRAFETTDYAGEFSEAHFPDGIETEIDRLTDLKSADETLHWGRNYLYTVRLSNSTNNRSPADSTAVVKMFPQHNLRARLRSKSSGSRARKSWIAALQLARHGVATPSPMAWIESKEPQGPSFYLCEKISDFFEIRYLFRALKAGTEADEFPQVELGVLFKSLGTAIRRLHDSGFWHRDLTVGNVLVRYNGSVPELFLVDLNRGRSVTELTLRQRCQDLGRLPIFDPGRRELLLEAYWGRPARTVERLLYRAHLRGFLLKNDSKRVVRAPFQKIKGWIRGRGTHAHIPAARPGATARERVVWDELSDQPHLHASPAAKLMTRLADAPIHLHAVWALTTRLPAVAGRYRKLKRQLYRRPFELPPLCLAISPDPERNEELLAAVLELGVRQLMIRLPLWKESLDAELELSQQLAKRGYELLFTLAQNRDLVRDRERWFEAIERVRDDFLPLGRTFQIGQAINRSKWGVWNYREYLEMAADAQFVLRAGDGRVQLLGPSVIDFEYHATIAALNLPYGGKDLHFDGVSSLLYVDRRGAPEVEQLRLDTVGKITLLKAIAESSKHSGSRCWITEFNWPLWEGPHSPAGKDASVDEESQANYLVRYYLLALTTGYVERVYWWQLVARGYGLMDRLEAGGFRRRESFVALRTLRERIDGARFERCLVVNPNVRMFELSRRGRHWVVAWSVSGRAQATLPVPFDQAINRSGQRIEIERHSEVELTESPIYFRLQDATGSAR